MSGIDASTASDRPSGAGHGERAVRVCAPGRLHLGFLDPDATLGRRFGSIGLVVSGFETAVTVRAATADALTGGTAAAATELGRTAELLQRLRGHTGCHQPLQIHLDDALPAHAGFGSGTQLALAVGRAFAQWHRLTVTTAELAGWLGRGLRSGVGIAGFDQGGLLVDGGPSPDGTPAPLLARQPLPASWRIVLLQDTGVRGLSGGQEHDAIARLAPLARADAADICHQVLMRVLPGAASGDFAAFARGITHVQQVLGRHFAPAQQGRAYASPAVERAMQWIAEARDQPAALGQSSWGPTAFIALPSATAAEALVHRLRQAGLLDAAGLDVHIVQGRNHGATVTDSASAPLSTSQTF